MDRLISVWIGGKGLRLAGTGHRSPAGISASTSSAGPAGSSARPVGDTGVPIPAAPTAGASGGFGKLVGKLLAKLEEGRSR